jgi:N-acetylmuramoyl-L-alanine amidase
MGKLFITCLLTCAVFVAVQANVSYLRTPARPGDGVYSLLRRYQLDGHACNFQQFYTLNGLSRNAGLQVGVEYMLPILLYPFDGQTIRSSIGQDDWNLAVTIRDYNRAMQTEALRQDSYEDSGVLWVPFHLLNCPEEELHIPPPVAADPEQNQAANGQRVFPIFGPDYAYTPLASNRLRGKVFYVVSGHGGPDPGAIGQRGNYRLCEDEYAYDVALRLCRNLIAHGATAYMINRDENDGIRNDQFLDCDQDEVIWGNIQQSPVQRTRLTQRSDVINELYEKHRLQGVTEQTVVVIHVDSRSRSERTDVFFYHHPSSEAGGELARRLQRVMRQKYRRYRTNGNYHGTVSARDLHMLRECTPTSVYIELANIRNIHDQQRIIIERNRQLLADWLLEGLLSP